MPYFAAALGRRASGWSATEVDLDEVETFADLSDMLRDLDEKADSTVLFLEEDDVYVAIVRVDGTDDPRVFVSDVRAADESRLATLLLDEVGTPEPVPFVVDDDLDESDSEADDDETESIDVVPAGDADLMADLGTPSAALLALCAHEGLLPADVITAISEKAGCIDELEEIRGG
ncbi:MAG: tRNA adenosine deaminase-associated protein [Mycobacteriales bacterium]